MVKPALTLLSDKGVEVTVGMGYQLNDGIMIDTIQHAGRLRAHRKFAKE